MLKAHFVTERELSEIATLANEVTCARCRKEKKFLRHLVQAYLGDAEAAEEAVLERCDRDPAYLESVVKNYVASLDEHELLGVLRASAGVSVVVERLGFNPFDDRRRESHRLAHRFINCRNQWIVLAIGVGAFCLMCLFPPWQMVRWQRQAWDPCRSGGPCPEPDKKVEVRFIGYRFAFADAPIEAAGAPQGPEVRENDWTYITYRWYWEMQLLQWLGLFVAVILMGALLRDSRSFEERIAALETGQHRNGTSGQTRNGDPGAADESEASST